jgi:hypothetical protein
MSTKVSLICLFIFAGLALFADATQKPVVHWKFDKIENNILKDSAGFCDGKVMGGSTDKYIRPGLNGNAFYFNNGKHHVKIPDSNNVSLKNNFTFEYTIMPFRVNSYRTIIWKGNRKKETEAINYFFDIRDGKPELKTKDANGKWVVYATRPLMKPNKWYHVIITYNDGECEFFINGNKASCTKYESGKIQKSLVTNSSDVVIGLGANSRSNAYFFCGLIDDIKIWNGRVVNIDERYGAKWRHLNNKFNKRMAAYQKRQKEKAEKATELAIAAYKNFFKTNAKNPKAPFIATAFPTSSRLVKEPLAFSKVKEFSRVVELCAARNEYEGFQVISFANPENKEVPLKTEVTDLVKLDGRGKIPASALALGFIKSVKSEKPDIPVDFTGEIPDVIINGKTDFEVNAYDFSPLYVKIFTGNATPGKYQGYLKLSNGGFEEKIKINLNVYDFALPQKGSLRTAFCFFEKFYKAWYNLKEIPDDKKRGIYDFLLSYRLSPNNIYTREAIYPNIKFLKEIRNKTNFFTIEGCGESKPLSDERLREKIEQTRKSIAAVKANGLQEDMYYYSYDEILGHFTEDKLAAVTQINTALKKEFPKLRMMQTSFPEENIENLFNVWVPIISYFGSEKKLKVLERLKKRGDEIWWYGADEPYHPYPNYFLDYPVFDCRIIMTLSYMYKVEGILYWSINREWETNNNISKQWPDAQWKPYIFHVKTGKRKYKNGMGNLVYPGKNGELLPSLRLENLRDGLEDYEYLAMLEKLVAENKKNNRNSTLVKEAEKLLKVPANVAVAAGDYSSEPENLLKYRKQIASMIERLKK